MWKLPEVPTWMPTASAAPSESLEYLLGYYRAAGRMAGASAVAAVAFDAVAAVAVDAVAAAAVVYYGRKRAMDTSSGGCVQTAEHLDIAGRTNW